MQRLLPDVAAMVAAYDRKTWGEVDEAHVQLTERYGLHSLLPLMIAACPSLKSWKARKTLLFYLLPHARQYPSLVDLALRLVNDRAGQVREEALGIVAYSLDVRALAELRRHLHHADPATRAAVLAAIDAIENQDHNLFIDRDHSGNARWLVRER
jgi:hypothetical protein